MSDSIAAIILGLIEGLTEFIPVSSTGHLLIAEDFMKQHGVLASILGNSDHREIFTIIIQSAAALALVPLFWKKFWAMIFDFRAVENRDLFMKLAAAFLITCGVGMAMKKAGLELPETASPVAWATLIGGFVIFGVEKWRKGQRLSDTLSWPIVIAFAVGQIIAMVFPGASRSGSTIMLALMLGLSRPAATEFSFLLGVPTLIAAGGYELMKAAKSGQMAGLAWPQIGLGLMASAVSAFIVVKWLIHFVKSHTFNGFAVYRVALGVLLLAWVYMAGGVAAG